MAIKLNNVKGWTILFLRGGGDGQYFSAGIFLVHDFYFFCKSYAGMFQDGQSLNGIELKCCVCLAGALRHCYRSLVV